VETLEAIESIEILYVWVFAYMILTGVIGWLGGYLNKLVVRANDGQMPVVENRTGDRSLFDKIIRKSDRHKWAGKNTKLFFLTDWINTPTWKNCPYWFAYWIYQSTNYNIIERQKISIGDILIWTCLFMWILLILFLFVMVIAMLVYLVLFLF